jgi:DNA-binding response OmpR family regulator
MLSYQILFQRPRNYHVSRKILAIEDSRDIAHLLELHLPDLGCEVDVVRDSCVGLERAFGTPYDLIILNLMVPGMEGLDICRRLRRHALATAFCWRGTAALNANT